MTQRPSIPESLSELTPEWLTATLREQGHLGAGRIVASEQQILGGDEGFLGVLARLSLRIDPAEEGAPASVVAKIPRTANRGIGEMLGVYEREVFFYRELAEEVPLRTPKLYYAELDRDRASEKQEQILRSLDKMPAWTNLPIFLLGRWIAGRKRRRYLILMEDLEGARAPDQLEGGSAEDCERLLRGVAAAHGSFWGSATLEGRFWLLPFDIDARSRNRIFRSSEKPFMARFAHLELSELPGIVQFIQDHGAEIGQALHDASPSTLIHCDLRLDNVFYPDGDDVIVFDWQLVRRGPAAYDIAYFISSALAAEASAAEEAALLRAYHESLVAAGVSDYEFDTLVRDYRRGLLLTLQGFGTIGQMEMGAERGRRLMDAWIERLVSRLRGVELAALL